MNEENKNIELPIHDRRLTNQPLTVGKFCKEIKNLSDYCKAYDEIMENDPQNSIYSNHKHFLENSLKFIDNHCKEIMRKSVVEYDYQNDRGYDRAYESFINYFIIEKGSYKEDLSSRKQEDKKVVSFKDAFKFIQQYLENIKKEVIPQEIINEKENELRKKDNEIESKNKEIKDLKNNLLVAKSVDNNTIWMIRFGWIASITAFLTNLDFVKLFPLWEFRNWFHLGFNVLFAIASGFFLFFFWKKFRPQNLKKEL